MKTKLNPEDRARMKDLIEGFVQHCEISNRLLGAIERTVEEASRKYGLPVFTFYGTDHPYLDTQLIGFIARNQAKEKQASEALLQLVERFIIHPDLASGLVARILPISDPIAFENGNSDRSPETAHELATFLDAFERKSIDGLVNVQTAPIQQLRIHIHGPRHLRQAASQATEALERLSLETLDKGFSTRLALSNVPDSDAWKLYIDIPDTWNSGLASHWVSQFLVIFLRNRLEILSRSVESKYLQDETYLAAEPINRRNRFGEHADLFLD